MSREHGYIIIDDDGNVTAYRSVDPISPVSLTGTSPGGSTAGAGRVLGPFPFAFDDAGLNDGIAFYTPTVGDILLDAWIEVTEAFDGTTPLADMGTFVGTTAGLFVIGPNSVDVSGADSDALQGGVGAPGLLLQSNGLSAPASLLSMTDQSSSADRRVVPARVTVANPLKIVVSQDGTAGGTAVGGTAGAGAVYLVVATPSLT